MRMRPGSWRCHNQDRHGRVRVNELTLSGATHCSGRERAQGHAWRRECARSWVPGDAAPFRLTQNFVSVPHATRPPMISPLDAANCYLSHVLSRLALSLFFLSLLIACPRPDMAMPSLEPALTPLDSLPRIVTHSDS